MARSNRRDCRTGERKRTADVQRRDQQIRSIRKEHKQQQKLRQQQQQQQQAPAPEAAGAGASSRTAAAVAELRAQIARSVNIPASKPAAAPKGGGS